MKSWPMTRRQCLSIFAAGALPFCMPGVSLSAQSDAGKIRIGGIETFVVHVNARGNWILVRLATDSGIKGLGEASHGRDADTLRYVALFAERLKGRGIFDIEWLRSAAAPEIAVGGTSAACALSALEQCLWDIIGQALNVPVYELFGGALRTSIRNYANINRSTDPRTPAGFAAMAERAVNAGFTAVKLRRGTICRTTCRMRARSRRSHSWASSGQLRSARCWDRAAIYCWMRTANSISRGGSRYRGGWSR